MLKQKLEEMNISYSSKKFKKNTEIYNIRKKFNLVCMINDESSYSVDRKLFDLLESEKMGYSFMLFNTYNDKVFYLSHKKYNNFLKKSFNSTSKPSINLGKIVLQNEISNEMIIKILEVSKKI